MFPYLTLPSVELGSLVIHPYGIFAGLGLVACAWVCFVRAKECGIQDAVINRTLAIAGGAALLGAHAFYILLRQPANPDPLGSVHALLRFWEGGYSSVGGLAGGAIALWLFTRLKGLSWMRLAEVLLQGLIAGWIVGRLGCTFAHDHPGTSSEFFLAVNYPDGARHDLGFYEFLYSLGVILPAMLLLRRRGAVPGSGRYLAAAALLYAPFRFGIEFLREPAHSVAWNGLAVGQWAALALLVVGIASVYFTDFTMRLKKLSKP